MVICCLFYAILTKEMKNLNVFLLSTHYCENFKTSFVFERNLVLRVSLLCLPWSWKKDPGCGWSRDHPVSGWQKNMLSGRGGRVFCLLLWRTLWVSNHLAAVAKNYSLYRRSKSNLPMKNATRFLSSSKYRRLAFTNKFGSQMEQKLFYG